MWLYSARVWSKAKRKRHVERLQRCHLLIKPAQSIVSKAIGPAQARAQISYAELFQRSNGMLQPMVLEMKPLTNAELGNVFWKTPCGKLGCAILFQQPHVEVSVVRRSFCF